MTILQLQIVTTVLVTLYFDVFGLHRIILKALGKQPFDDCKPWSCYFCMSMWFGFFVVGNIIGEAFFTGDSIDWELVGTFLGLNFIVSRVLDIILGYASIKGK